MPLSCSNRSFDCQENRRCVDVLCLDARETCGDTANVGQERGQQQEDLSFVDDDGDE